LSLVDQLHQLSGFKGLASNAAAVSLDFGEKPVNVVRLLDSGRGIVQGHIFNMRSAIRGIPDDLTHEYESLMASLDPPFGEPSPFTADQSYRRVDLRHRAALDFDRLLVKIRDGDKFDKFGLKLTQDVISEQVKQDAILEQAKEGPIVILNISEHRSDALIVTEADVLCHSLNLEVAAVELQVERFRKAIVTLTRPTKGTTQK